MGTRLTAYVDRTFVQAFVKQDGSGNVATLAVSDEVRVKVGVPGVSNFVDMSNATPTAGGSSITINARSPQAKFTVEITETDLASVAVGSYSLEVSRVDSNDSNRTKVLGVFAIDVLASQPGAIGA